MKYIGQDYFYMAHEENRAQKGEWGLPKHTSKQPGKVEKYTSRGQCIFH